MDFIEQLKKENTELKEQIQKMWKGFEEGISVDEMNQRLFPEAEVV